MRKVRTLKAKVLVLLCCILTASITIFSFASGKTDEGEQVNTVVAATQMNVLFVGIENSITVASSVIEPSDMKVSTNNGTVTGKNGQYVIIPARPGLAIVNVYDNNKQIQSTQFRVKSGVTTMPVLWLDSFNFKTSGTLTKEELFSAMEVSVIAHNSDFDPQFEVLSFSLGDSIVDISTNGSKLSVEQRAFISRAKPNTKIFIDNVQVKLNDGSSRRMPGMTFLIRN